MERGTGPLSAVQEVQKTYGIPVVAIANLGNLLEFLQDSPEFGQNIGAIRNYRDQYGAVYDA